MNDDDTCTICRNDYAHVLSVVYIGAFWLLYFKYVDVYIEWIISHWLAYYKLLILYTCEGCHPMFLLMANLRKLYLLFVSDECVCHQPCKASVLFICSCIFITGINHHVWFCSNLIWIAQYMHQEGPGDTVGVHAIIV